MGKHLLSFMLSELMTVRIICRGCGSIVELAIENLGTRFADATCRICKKDLMPPEKTKALLDLDNAIAAIKQSSAVEIEFVIPIPP